MSVIFAKTEADQCASTHRPDGAAEPVRCTRVKGHGGYHQDERYSWGPMQSASEDQGGQGI